MKLAQIMPEALNGLAAWFGMVIIGFVAFFNLKGKVAVLEQRLKSDRTLTDEKLDRIAEDVAEIKTILDGLV